MNYCIVCNQQEAQVIFKEFGIDIVRCQVCQHVYSTYEQGEDYSDYFNDEIAEADHFWWKEAHEKMYEAFIRQFIKKKAGKLLDVGCGLGYFLKKISKNTTWDAYGVEISKVAVDYTRNKLGLKNIYLGKVESADFPDNYFDVITLWDVIEHIPNPKPLLKHLHKALKDDGVLFIHTPNIRIQLPKAKIKKLLKGMKPGVHYLEAKDHINIYSPQSIKKHLEQNNFKSVQFTHLPPIQSVAGSKSTSMTFIKNCWYQTARLLAILTGRKINLDNLFVVAKKV